MGTKANPSKPKGAKLEQEPPCPEGEPLERNKLLKPMFSNVPQLFSFVFLCFHCLSFVFQLFSNGFPMDWVVSLRFSLVFHCLPMFSNAFHCFPFVFQLFSQWFPMVVLRFAMVFSWLSLVSLWLPMVPSCGCIRRGMAVSEFQPRPPDLSSRRRQRPPQRGRGGQER